MKTEQNSGINEFPLSIDFFNNPKICAVTVEHGIKGQIAAIMLLYTIYRNGYFIEWTQENCVVILKELPGIKIKKMEKIVKTLVEWEFFDSTMFEQYHVLTNRDIQQHFINTAQSETLSAKTTLPYWLIEDNADDDANDDEDNAMETIDSHDENTNTPINAEVLVDFIMSERQWMEDMCAKNQMDRAELLEMLGKFSIESRRHGIDVYNSIAVVKNNFCRWLSTGQIT